MSIIVDNVKILGYGSGWDIIVPSGWGMPVWLCLIMWGAKVGGLRETDSIQYEMGHYNILPPDTKAGRIENDDLDNKYRTKYFKLPPNKRVNYNKFAISSPFKCDWNKLFEPPEQKIYGDQFAIDKYHVLRDKQILNHIKVTVITR